MDNDKVCDIEVICPCGEHHYITLGIGWKGWWLEECKCGKKMWYSDKGELRETPPEPK